MFRSARLILVLAVLGLATPAFATFHLMSISELGAGFLGNPNVQFVELRLDGVGQTHLTGTRLTVFDKDGNAAVLLVTPNDVANGTAGRNVLYATAEFQSATGIVPDFVIPAGVVEPSGMVCWGAPDADPSNPPDPSTWDFDKPENYVDCVAYGGYPYATRMQSGTPTSLLPGDGVKSLTRAKNTGAAGSNDTDFVLAAATPCNNANQCADLTPSPTATPTPAPSTSKAQVKCRRAVIKAASKFAAAEINARVACETQRLKGKIVGPCPDAKADAKVAAADAKRTKAIVKACGALSAADAGFGATCPGYTGACTAPITDVAGVSACVDCGVRRADDELATAGYGAAPDPTLRKCQLGLGKALTGHYRAIASLLARCEDAAARGKIVGACPDAKTAAKIAAKNAKLHTTLCKACGGADKTCDGVGDASPASLGLTSCPARTIPGGSACGDVTIASLADVATCLECLATFENVCTSALAAHPNTLPASCGSP